MKIDITITTEATKSVDLVLPAFWHYQDAEHYFELFYRASASGRVDTITRNSDGWECAVDIHSGAGFSRWLGRMIASDFAPCDARKFYDAVAEMRAALDEILPAQQEKTDGAS